MMDEYLTASSEYCTTARPLISSGTAGRARRRTGKRKPALPWGSVRAKGRDLLAKRGQPTAALRVALEPASKKARQRGSVRLRSGSSSGRPRREEHPRRARIGGFLKPSPNLRRPTGSSGPLTSEPRDRT